MSLFLITAFLFLCFAAICNGIGVNRPIRNRITISGIPLACDSSNNRPRLRGKSEYASEEIVGADTPDSRKSYGGLIVNAIAISALVVQNSGLTITMRLSRLRPSPVPYVASTAVVISEVTKLLLSGLFFYFEEKGKQHPREMLHTLYGNKVETAQTAVPSALYVIQNNLQYLATSNLPAEVYQVLIQMNLITTALLSSTFLGKTLYASQWLSIFLLFVGVAIVQLSLTAKSTISHFNPWVGFVSVIISCFTSGFAGVYNERLLQTGASSLWCRNIQMTSVSVVLSLLACLVKDLPTILRGGFFQGYAGNPMLLAAISLQAVGGLLVSLVVKNCGSITKSFATSGSIILSCFLSSMLLNDTTMNMKFFFGTNVVIAATIMYSYVAVSKNTQKKENKKLMGTQQP